MDGSDYHIHTGYPSVTQFENQTKVTADRDYGLAEWIIDDSCVVIFYVLIAQLEQKQMISTQSLQEMVEKIKSKPTLEQQLERALEIQRKIKSCDQQHKKLMDEKLKIEEKIQGYKLDPEYRNERQIQKLVKTLAEIQTLATAMESSNINVSQVKKSRSSKRHQVQQEEEKEEA